MLRGVADTIKRTSSRSGRFKPKGVATGVSGHSVIVKRVVVPAATPTKLRLQFTWIASSTFRSRLQK